TQRRWRPPNPNELIMNTDAAVRPHDNFAGIGVCIRDHSGCVIACCLKRINGKLSSESAEILVVREGFLFAQQMNLSISVIETDANRVVQSILLDPQPLADTALVFSDIFHLMSIVNYGTSRYIPREQNEVAH
ncbi:Ribonuclease H-like domain containing protein, partial [Parasponia andersonii]